MSLESNGRFTVKAAQSGYHDSYNDHIQTYVFDRSDTAIVNDFYLPSRAQTAAILGETPDPTLGMVGGTVVGRDFHVSTCGPCGSGGKATLGFFNNDTILDLALISGTSVNILYGDGTGSFTANPTPCFSGSGSGSGSACPAGNGASDILSADLNQDGTADLVVADAGSDSVSILVLLR